MTSRCLEPLCSVTWFRDTTALMPSIEHADGVFKYEYEKRQYTLRTFRAVRVAVIWMAVRRRRERKKKDNKKEK